MRACWRGGAFSFSGAGIVWPRMTLLMPAESQFRASGGRGGDWQLPAALLAIGVFAALSIAVGASSQGFLEADGCTHYLYARFAFEEPHFLVNVWGRPLFTALYAIPAKYAGVQGAHLLSLVLAVGCALVAQSIARGQGYRWPVLALIFTLAQPLVFLHSFSELTELPFAALLGLAFLAYQRKSWVAVAVLAGLLPLARPEGFAFLLLAAIALFFHRRLWWLLILPLPLILWNHAGWLISGREGPWWGWLPANWPYAGQSLYEKGHPLHFIALLPAVTSPFIFPATCLGLWRSLRGELDLDPHLRICRRLIALIPLLILIGHSVLYATGRLASSGELRYMLVVAPFWGLLAACGWEWVFARLDWPYPIGWAGTAALAGALANALYPVVPLRPAPDEDFARCRQFVRWYRASGMENRFPRVCTAEMFIYYFLDVSPTDPRRALEYRRDKVSTPPPGTILIWDKTYSLYNADARRSIPFEELLTYGWLPAPDVPVPSDDWRVFLSATPAATQEAPRFQRIP